MKKIKDAIKNGAIVAFTFIANVVLWVVHFIQNILNAIISKCFDLEGMAQKAYEQSCDISTRRDVPKGILPNGKEVTPDLRDNRGNFLSTKNGNSVAGRTTYADVSIGQEWSAALPIFVTVGVLAHYIGFFFIPSAYAQVIDLIWVALLWYLCPIKAFNVLATIVLIFSNWLATALGIYVFSIMQGAGHFCQMIFSYSMVLLPLFFNLILQRMISNRRAIELISHFGENSYNPNSHIRQDFSIHENK